MGLNSFALKHGFGQCWFAVLIGLHTGTMFVLTFEQIPG